MKTLNTSRTLVVPKEVKVAIKSRVVTVTGPRGKLSRSFKHIQVDLQLIENGRIIKAELWFGNRKAVACVRTVISHIQNMFTGVTKGFQRKMRMVYAHFPINVSIEGDGRQVALRNFLGEKVVRMVTLPDGVDIERSTDVKDELIITGNNVEHVSQSAAQINQKCLVRNKDIRKFLDGVYVSESGYAQ